mgnify:FL=1
METIERTNYELTQSEGLTLKIEETKQNSNFLLFPLVLAIIIISIPIILLIFIVRSGEGIPLGFLITCIVAIFSSGYLLKLYLWNKYGKECFIIKNGTFLHFYDYRLFNDYQQKCDYKTINVRILYQGELREPNSLLVEKMGSDTCCSIYFLIDNDIVVSHTFLPIEVIEKISELIKQNNKVL